MVIWDRQWDVSLDHKRDNIREQLLSLDVPCYAIGAWCGIVDASVVVDVVGVNNSRIVHGSFSHREHVNTIFQVKVFKIRHLESQKVLAFNGLFPFLHVIRNITQFYQ
ncbi:hypothetical protein WICPIJ_006156 [Wickerhamomyces pijperi]|uniref:Uncharacterized protein n=1 Tax=Wickerhamomyces pijperi TaxID=599730 RepID=A0A9P8Q4X8_WICPI|nr:hypothetical protein WICPIJ_006156 [Wickerhamomyces pijperi]